MTLQRLSDLAVPRVRSSLPEGPIEATVLSAPATTLDYLYVTVDAQPSQRHGPFPWVANGRMPQAGDGCLLMHGSGGEIWAMVRSTGPLVTA